MWLNTDAALSLVLFGQSRLVFLYKEAFFATLSILTVPSWISFRQESFEEMKILVKAILKFCTTNQLFDSYFPKYLFAVLAYY